MQTSSETSMAPGGMSLFKIYCGLMAFIYAAVCALAVVVPLAGIDMRTEDLITFGIMGVVSFPFMLAFGYGLFLPRTKWAWVYGCVLIAVGLGSCCFWPICIPLLMKWIEPELKDWFEPPSPSGTDGW